MSITKNEEGRDSVTSLCTSSMQQITSEASTTARAELSSSYPRSPATRKLIRRLSFQDANRNIMESKYMGFLAIFIAIRVAMSTKNSNQDFSLTDLIPGGNHSFNTRTWMLVYFSLYLFILHRGRARRSLSSILEQLYTKCQQIFQSGTESSNGTQLKPSRTSTESLAQRMKRIGSQQRWGSFQATFKFEQGGADGHVSVLSATEPFVPTDVTANMTLNDLTIVLRYAFNLPKDQVNLTDDSNNLSDTLKQVFRNLDSATRMSRGNDVEPARPSSPNADYGDADALRFCAAVRLYTEWHIVRCVPEGYKGYAVGMNIGKKDTIQNVAKIEHAVHSYINYMKGNESSPSSVVTSPTLRQLLQHEIHMNVHRRLPKLNKNSAAMGLLWIVRGTRYQSLINNNLLEIPVKYASAKEAVSEAYKAIFGQYHGWAIQKIFTYSFNAAPGRNIIYQHMNQHRLQEYVEAFEKHAMANREEEEQKKGMVSLEKEEKSLIFEESEGDQIIQKEFQSERSQNMEENSWLLIEDDDESSDSIPPVSDISFLSEMSFEVEPSDDESFEQNKQKKRNLLEEFGEHIGAEMDKFGKHVEGEWKKFTKGIVKIFDNQQKKEKKLSKLQVSRSSLCKLKEQEESQNKQNTTQSEKLMLDIKCEDFISKEMVKDACQQVMMHLEVVNPAMKDLAEMINELNMNDPTRV
eukprot:CAMPEP_0195305538 /NCGR_PEP_ID=MMETSP0707-20130614/36441_1 /TAXON_ID=33640 /ORGANISM="Asterionellopsis glacialis, Strain CCMP134" /LENGTH=691 /DNA_ID=CAMNT_0040369683 /DNA_START=142 /DNA_END=2217 /DNA_ORIENTATION=+